MTGPPRSSFIPSGGVHDAHRNSFLPTGNVDSDLHHGTKLKGQASTKTKRSGAMPIGKGKTGAPGKGSLRKITPK